MKHRWLLIAAWFVALFVFNVAYHWSQNSGQTPLYITLAGLGAMTTPLQLLLSAAVVIGLMKRKPMADR
jgi:hypothetical protein